MSSQDQIEVEPLRVTLLEMAGPVAAGWHGCVVGEHIRFHTDGLESFCFAASRPVIYDLMLVAAGVELCDKSRHRPRHGWRRTFMLDVPVHDPAMWKSQTVADQLCHALELLTGDEWLISFRARSAPIEAPAAPTLPLPIQVGAVMPYSDGLDSRAVAAVMEASVAGELVKVRLGPIKDPDGAGRQHFAKVPYSVRPLLRVSESSGRSRAFKFTSLAAIAAALAGTSRIIMAESLQGALGPSIIPVGHAYEDYRNHPVFTQLMEAFLSAVLRQRVAFEYPRLWSTKAETISRALGAGASPERLISTRSCWQDSRWVSFGGRRRQCGICAACMLRRMSLSAAGLQEPTGIYIWENLSAPSFLAAALPGFNPRKITRSQREYAIAGALHMEHLAELPLRRGNAEELVQAAFRLTRPLALPEREIEGRIKTVLERHRTEWRQFLSALAPESFLHSWTTGDLP